VKPHPDRLALNLAHRATLPPDAWNGPFQVPGPGSDDARVDFKLLAFEVRSALAARGTPAAHARLEGLTGADLWAGAVRDGTARGMRVALEEALSLCAPAPAPLERGPAETVLERAELRRHRDLLVASGGARIRFSRKLGVLFVDRRADLNVPGCVSFEDRTDRGTLDGFAPEPGERPRLFHPGFLPPVRYETWRDGATLIVEGRLGRGPRGYPCRIRFEGRAAESRVRIAVAIENRHPDHRLRIRFSGLPAEAIHTRGTPAWEDVLHAHGRFRAGTLVRACGKLQVGDELADVPDAQCLGWIEHHFELGVGG
jgi:hypothetical protein